MYGDCGCWVFRVDVVNGCLCVCNECLDVCVWSSVDVYDCMDWICFSFCSVYFNYDCCCVLDMYVVVYSHVYIFVYIYCDVCFVYCLVVCDGIAVLVGLVG